MGFLSKLVGVGDAAEVIGATGKALDGLFTSKDEKMTHAEIMAKIQQDPQRWQYQINLAEAAHRSLFVAGARPFILWVCGLGLANSFIINPWIQWVTGAPGPVLPLETMMELVIAVLGLSGLRTVEKMTGRTK